jgi:hypothetical protein
VKGFSVEMKSSLINSYSNMTFTIRLDSSDRLPMGTMQLFVDFGDGSLLERDNFVYLDCPIGI